MYFEEPWFVNFCFRLDCSYFTPMTSNSLNENVDEIEEGEIQDDDDTIVLVDESQKKKHPEYLRPLLKNERSCQRASRRSNFSFSQSFRPESSQHVSSPSVPSVESRGREPPSSNLSNRSKRKPNRIRPRRGRNRPKPSRLLPRSTPYRNRRQNVQDRSRARTPPYEEKLKEFRSRQERMRVKSKSPERIRVKSKSQERKTSRSNMVGFVDSPNAGSSLLKRLVGSGSVGIKISVPIKNNLSGTIDFPNEDLTGVNLSKVKDIPIPDILNDTVTNSLLVAKMPGCPEKIELKVSKDLFNSTENVSDSLLDPDDDLIKLRMEALKTAVLKKHSERLKRGYVPKKINKEQDDLIVDFFLEEVESFVSLEPVETSSGISSPPLLNSNSNDLNCDNSDMSLDSNYVSDDDTVGQNKVSSPNFNDPKPDGLNIKRHHKKDEIEIKNKRQKLEDHSEDIADLNHANLTSDLNDEELELRALALQSFLKRKVLKESDENDSTCKNAEHKETSISNLISVKEQGEDKTQSVRNDSENWEELDEDILRAQLLKTLSANLPIQYNKPDSPGPTMKISVPALTKKEIDSELEIQSKRWSEMMVPKLVISLGSDSESEPENTSRDFVKSLDLFLFKAKEKSEKLNTQIESKPKVKKKISPKHTLKKPLLKRGPSGTPTAVKHLPIQQQEEYRRLKMKLAEKLKLNQNKSSPDVSPGTSRTQSPMRTKGNSSDNILQSKDSSLKPNINNTIKSSPKIIKTSSAGSITKSVGPILGLKSKTDNIVNSASVNLRPPNIKTKTIAKIVPGVTKKETVTDFRKHILKSKVSSEIIHNSKILSAIPSYKPGNNTLSGNLKAIHPKNKSVDPLSNNIKTEKTSTLVKKQMDPPSLIKTPPLSIKESVSPSGMKKVNPEVSKSLIKPDICVEEELTQSKTEGKCLLPDKVSELPGAETENMKLGIQILREDGTSDKENEVMKIKENINEKSNIEEKNQENKRLPFIECKLSGESLLEKIKEAETKYDETLTLITKLEKELEEAKNTLTQRGRMVAELKGLVKGPKDQASFTVKLADEGVIDKDVTEIVAQVTLPLPSERCWDPDGVLCPYQLAGSCKDSSCPFHHICS